jgi:hypothetical protein
MGFYFRMEYYKGPGKLTYMFSAIRMQISAPRQASVGRASRRGSGKRKSAYVQGKTYMLIYPYPYYKTRLLYLGVRDIVKVILTCILLV